MVNIASSGGCLLARIGVGEGFYVQFGASWDCGRRSRDLGSAVHGWRGWGEVRKGGKEERRK